MKAKLQKFTLLICIFTFIGTSVAQGTPGFTGQDADSASGLTFLRSRYYDPETGTLLTKDPIGVAGGLNAYQYCGSDPVNCVDPDGDFAFVDTLIAGAAGALVGVGVQAVGDIIRGKVSSGADYAAAAAGGAAFGVTATINPFASGAAAGAAANLTRQVIGGQQFSAQSFLTETAVSSLSAGGLAQAGPALNNYLANTLSSQAKGTIGEGLSGLSALGRGEVPYAYQEAIVSTGSKADFLTFDALSGENNIIEAKTSWSPSTIRGAEGNPLARLKPAQLNTMTQVGNGTLAEGFDNYIVENWIMPDIIGSGLSGVGSYGANQLPVGGVLLDKAATLVGQNLTEITGAMYDPVSGQFVILGTNSPAPVKNIKLDYLYTALQAVYGSAVPPFVTLVPSATITSSYSEKNLSINLNNQILKGNFTSPFYDGAGCGNYVYIVGPGYYNGMYFTGTYTECDGDGSVVIFPHDTATATMPYAPVWPGEDTTVDVVMVGVDYGPALTQTKSFSWKARFNCVNNTNLVFSQWVADTWDTLPPSSIAISYGNGTLQLANGPDYILITEAAGIPARQQRQFGGRLENTLAGWVMEEADRTMKCLTLGSNNLTGAIYNHSTVNVSGYSNLFERFGSTIPSGFSAHQWFTPQLMTLNQYIDPNTGTASVVFSNATVLCQTEAMLTNGPSPAQEQAFCANMTTNYDAFAALQFPCYDPTDPTHTRVISTNIFGMLKDVMKAVSLARFFRDNNIPVDMWWLNSWQPTVAYTPRSVPTIMAHSASKNYFMEGGVSIQLPNTYIASVTASNVALTVQSSRPGAAGNTNGDIQAQVWTNTTSVGTLNAVAANTAAEPQDGNVNLAETDLSFPSPGSMPLKFTRYYQSSWLGGDAMGPGWLYTPYVLQFSRPSWFDDYGWMKDGTGNLLPVFPGSFDTGLHSDAVRVVNVSTGATLDFVSSLVLGYAVDTNKNPYITLAGLAASGVPTFTAGLRQNGSVLVQLPDQREYQLNNPDGSALLFDHNGKLILAQDRNGYGQVYNYDGAGRLLSISDSAQQSLVLGYDSQTNYLTLVIGPGGEQINYTYTNGCLATATHLRSGAYTTYQYNTNRQLTSKTLFNGLNALQPQPDLKGRASTNVDLRGNSLTKTFTQGSAGAVRTNEIRDPLNTDPQFVSARLQRDRSGRLLASRSVTGAETSYGYNTNSLYPNTVALPIAGRPPISIQRNAYGQPTRISDPGNTNAQDVTAIYDPNTALLRQISDEAGRTTHLNYDGNQNLTNMQTALGAQTVNVNFAYTASGVLSSVTNPLGVPAVTVKRDNLDRVTNVVDATGISMGYQYDSLGRLSAVIDPRLSSPVTYVYDNFDRITEIHLPAGTNYYTYDLKMGWLSSQTDLLGRTTRFDRDPKTGDLLQTVQIVPGGPNLTTVMSYNRFGNLATVVPPQSSLISYNYDASGRQIGTAYSGGGVPDAPGALVCNNATNGQPTTSVNFVFSWQTPTSTVGINGYSYALDQMPATVINTIGTSATINGVAVGTHLFQVCAQGTNGLWGPTADFQLIVTNAAGSTPPGAPPTLVCDHAFNGVPVSQAASYTFSWSVPTSQSGIAGYSYALDQTPPSQVCTTGTSAYFANVSVGTHYFHVCALGNNGVWGPTSDFALLITPSAGGIAVTCDHATNGLVTYYTNLVFSWSVNSPNSIAGYVYGLDSAPNSPLTNAASVAFNNLTAGAHYFQVSALGYNGLWTPASEFTFTVLNPPSAPQGLACNNAINGVPTASNNGVFSWQPPASSAGLNGYSYGFDQTPAGVINTTAASVAINNIALGIHQFQVMAQDTNGVWGATASFTLIVSQPPGAPPSLVCDHATNGLVTYYSNFLFSWAVPGSQSGVAGYSYALDQTPPSQIMTTTTSASIIGVPFGIHQFQVRALGQGTYGVWGPISTFLLRVASPPSAPSGLVCNNATNGMPTTFASFVFSWQPPATSAGVNGYSYGFDQAPGNTVNTVGTAAVFNNVTVGSHQFHVKAQDTNGVWGATADFQFVEWAPGTEPPGAPLNLYCYGIGNGVPTYTSYNIVFSWQTPSSESGVAGYSYALNATPANTISTTTTSATLDTVPIGTNIFQVMAKGNNGVWGPVSSFTLIIRPPNIDTPLLPPWGIALLASMLGAVGYISLVTRRTTVSAPKR